MHTDSGQIVGDYKVIEHIGTGAVGRVYKVEHLVTKRLEAMKVLNSGYAPGSEQLQRFEREIRLQASLKHRNICQVYNAFLVDSDLVMIMELVEGWTLQRRLEHGRLTLPEAIGIMRQILTALAHAHENQILHRDLKPANVLLAGDGTIKLTDFGLAIEPSDAQLTEQGTPVGTYYYMSPELIKGVRPLTERADIYSAGVLFFELVTGRRPFEHTEAFELMTAHVKQTPPPPRAIDDSVPVSIERVVMKALAKNPKDRYASASAFLAALEVAATTRPDDEESEKIVVPIDWSRYTGWITSGRTWFALGGSLCAVALVLAITAPREEPPKPLPSITGQEPAKESPTPTVDLTPKEPVAAATQPESTSPPLTIGPRELKPQADPTARKATVRQPALASKKKTTAPAPVVRVHGMEPAEESASASPGPLAPPPLPNAAVTPVAAPPVQPPPVLSTRTEDPEPAAKAPATDNPEVKRKEPVFKRLRSLNPFRKRGTTPANASGQKDRAPNP